MSSRNPAASIHTAMGVRQGIAIGRAEAAAACRRIVELTSRPICGTARPDLAEVLTLVEHVLTQGWDIDKIIAREEHREPSGDVGGGWVWAVYRDDDTMMTELHRRAARSPA